MERAKCIERIRKEVEYFKQNYRNDNSAFLIWFLKNIYCLSEQDSVDAVCDGQRDKGIDAIYYDENDDNIIIFQSEFSPNDDQGSGDSKIREFAGVMNWFKDSDSVRSLESALINEELKRKLINLSISDKIEEGCEVSFVYITNKVFDRNATEFLSTTEIEGFDNNKILQQYIYIAEEEIQKSPITISIQNETFINYENKSIVLSIPATELIKLEGIQDQTLFSRNVRLWQGNSRVNKDLVKTIKNIKEHDNFFLYHNGISIVCTNYSFQDKALTLENYQVINGCQSLKSLYQNRDFLDDKLQILTKIIRIQESDTALASTITKNANNQNAIALKDLKSNDRIQIALKRTFKESYSDKVFYQIKRGETAEKYQNIITIDYAAQLITAFYLGESYKTHLKTNFFSSEYEKIFSRDMNCHRIYLAHIIFTSICNSIEKVEDEKVRAYGLARFSILSIIKRILENDRIGKEILSTPQAYLTASQLNKFYEAITKLFSLVVLDYNDFLIEYTNETGFLDYKNLFKNKEFCEKLTNGVLTAHKKAIVRHPEDSFERIYREMQN